MVNPGPRLFMTTFSSPSKGLLKLLELERQWHEARIAQHDSTTQESEVMTTEHGP